MEPASATSVPNKKIKMTVKEALGAKDASTWIQSLFAAPERQPPLNSQAETDEVDLALQLPFTKRRAQNVHVLQNLQERKNHLDQRARLALEELVSDVRSKRLLQRQRESMALKRKEFFQTNGVARHSKCRAIT